MILMAKGWTVRRLYNVLITGAKYDGVTVCLYMHLVAVIGWWQPNTCIMKYYFLLSCCWNRRSVETLVYWLCPSAAHAWNGSKIYPCICHWLLTHSHSNGEDLSAITAGRAAAWNRRLVQLLFYTSYTKVSVQTRTFIMLNMFSGLCLTFTSRYRLYYSAWVQLDCILGTSQEKPLRCGVGIRNRFGVFCWVVQYRRQDSLR